MAKATLAIAPLLLSGVFPFAPPLSSLPQPTRSGGRRCIQHFPLRTTTTTTTTTTNRRRHRVAACLRSANDDNVDGMLAGDEIETVVGGNWIRRSASVDPVPAETNGNSDDDESVRVDVGIDGATFDTGDLSRRMHEAMMRVAAKKFPDGNVPEELGDMYLQYSMDASAKEAVKAAMDGNDLVLDLGDDEAMQDEGTWGQISSVVLLDRDTGEPARGEDGSESYDSFAGAIAGGGWEPGEGYSFVAREVPAREKAMDLEALLRAMDPDGTLWEEAQEKGIVMPGDETGSLEELAKDCEQRVKSSPVEADDESNAFRGGTSKGYNVISRSALLKDNRNADGTENQKTLLHVMDSLANHGCLIVDLTDGDTATNDESKMSKMWETTAKFFDKVVNDEDAANGLPPMRVAEGVGSPHAVVGFASFKDGGNQFMETRLRRSDGALLPEGTSALVGADGCAGMAAAFAVMSAAGKDVVRVATAASGVEAGAFAAAGDGARAEALASDAAVLLAEEIVDDGTPSPGGGAGRDEGPVSMSPHRMCRYSAGGGSSGGAAASSEIFGAHTDTSFVTIVPAAEVSGLEVFDEGSLRWYRPELAARDHAGRASKTGNPWHCRYLIVVPGELLQLTSRNNVPAAVHRVVATTDASPRLSAPALLRARPGTRMDVGRYVGGCSGDDGPLLESDGMMMEEIHNALQPSRKE